MGRKWLNGSSPCFSRSSLTCRRFARTARLPEGLTPIACRLTSSAPDVGGRGDVKEIQILYVGRAHTRGDSIVFVPQDRIVYLSELFFADQFLFINDGTASRVPYQTPFHGLPTRNCGLAPCRGRYFWMRPLFTSAT